MTFDWHARAHRAALDGMRSLTLEERGAYQTILDLIYDRDGPVPDDDRWLAGWMGVGVRRWRLLRQALIAKDKVFELQERGGPYLMNRRAAEELEDRAARSRGCAEAGAKGGRRRAENASGRRPAAAPAPPAPPPSPSAPPTERDQADAMWATRLAEAHVAGGEGISLTTPAMHIVRDLRQLCEPVSGEPCTWDEVLDAIQVCAAKAKTRGKPIRSWTWIREDALAIRDRRLNAHLPDPKVPHERRDARSPASDAYLDKIGDIGAAMSAAFQPNGG